MTQTMEVPLTKTRVHEDGSYFWTLEQYHQVIEAGVLGPDDKVELLQGKIVKKMSIKPPHAICVELLTEYFILKYAGKFRVRSENPVTLKNDSEPEPDLSVSEKADKDSPIAHPVSEEVRLIIEVADQSLRRDRTHKMSIYAQSGIPEYWIVNLNEEKVEVYLNPDESGGTYESVIHYRKGNHFTSPFVGEVAVSDLLP